MHRFVAAAALLIFSACGERCPLILHVPQLRFELSEAAADSFERNGEVSVETCLNTTCWAKPVLAVRPGPYGATWHSETRLLTLEQSVPVPGDPNGARTYVSGAPKSDVSLTMSADGGVLFTRTWADVPFNVESAEGSTCGGPETSEVLAL